LINNNASHVAASHWLWTTSSAAVRSWFLRNGLQLNPDKSEVVIVGTSHQLRSAASISSIDVAGSRLPVSDKLKSLGVTINSSLRFDCHAINVAMPQWHAIITLEPFATFAAC